MLEDFSNERLETELKDYRAALKQVIPQLRELQERVEYIQSQIESLERERKRRYKEQLEKNFKLTDEHIKLLQNMQFEGLWLGDAVSIGVDGKRPFGNSNCYRDIAEILGWKLPNDTLSDEQQEKADRLLDELPLAVNHILKNQK
jgi:TolA-binding protein